MNNLNIFTVSILITLFSCNETKNKTVESDNVDSIKRTKYLKDSLAKLTSEYKFFEEKLRLLDEENEKLKLKSKYQNIVDSYYEKSIKTQTKEKNTESKELIFNSAKFKRKMIALGFKQIGKNDSNNFEGEDSGYKVVIKEGTIESDKYKLLLTWDIEIKEK